jgi:hypothetical protein
VTTQHEHDGTGPADAAGPRPPILALSVQQPWAWAITDAGKTVENRTWTRPHRGPIAIHASLPWNKDGARNPLVQSAWRRATPTALRPDAPGIHLGAVIATADLTDICTAKSCGCGPWSIAGQNHWHLAGVRALPAPIPATGRLGLWTMPDDVRAAVAAALTGREAIGRG